MGGRAIHRDNSGLVLGANGIGGKALAIIEVIDLDLLVLANIGGFQQHTINRAGTLIFKLGMRHIGMVQLGF